MPRPPTRTSGFSRRTFLASAAASTAAVALSRSRVYGANDRVNLGFIAVGGRGSHSASWFNDLNKPASAEAAGKGPALPPENVRVASLCDADTKVLGNVHKKYKDAKAEVDFRKILDDKDVHAVVISTCNHWHALAAVWAIQAGKDVYVEKPVSNNVWEGRKIVEAARKYNKIVQGGTQQRSDPVQKQVKEFIKSGKLGKMLWIRGNRFGVRDSIGKRDKPMVPPADVNYDLWLGPAQDQPIFREKFHYDWHWVWNTGSGEMGNWGVHILDDIRNMLDDQCTLPKRILSAGGRVAWNDAGETPNAHTVYFDTGVVPVIFSLSNLPLNKERKTAATVWRGQPQSGYVIAFENGYYSGARGGGWVLDKDWKKVQQFKGDGGGLHARNFIEAVRNRKPQHLNAEIEVAHLSSSWCHLANVAYQLGKGYTREQHEAAAKDFAPWTELVDGFHKHLEANEVDAAKAALKVSTMLEIDPAKETFVGQSATPEALALLRREYRKPYVMPEQV
ncbi:MAG TPA: Gfo/Idh/MocA family oxidoreductase [Tepidisphaeraceae bacterium]|nr:Gfo/Idh/MocA family oxidoreductase [Tepidisphaeraceae bacterium]